MKRKAAKGRNRGASRSIDTGRLARNLAYPGIDSRIWVSLAFVSSRTPTIEVGEGVFIDVVLMPSEIQETARLSAVYAGPDYGLYCPVEFNDEVLVMAPSGDPNQGLVVLPRMWSPSDKPPAQLVDHPLDFFLVVKDGQSGRFVASGAGEFTFVVGASGAVRLGAEDAAQSVVRGDEYRHNEDFLNNAQLAFNAAVAAFAASYVATAGVPNPVTLGVAALIATAQANYITAKTAFDSSAATYLQPKVKVE